MSMKSDFKYSARFDGLIDGYEYTASISTELDGRTITQSTFVIMKGIKIKEEKKNKDDKEDKDKDNGKKKNKKKKDK